MLSRVQSCLSKAGAARRALWTVCVTLPPAASPLGYMYVGQGPVDGATAGATSVLKVHTRRAAKMGPNGLLKSIQTEVHAPS